MVSIVVLTDNNSFYLKECLTSIFEQTYNEIEIVISDNNSCDFDEKEVLGYIQKNKSDSIKNIIIHKQDSISGKTVCCQNGLELANGEFVCFLDVKNKMHSKNSLNRVLKEFEKNESCNVVVMRSLINDESKPFDIVKYPNDKEFYLAEEADSVELLRLISTMPRECYIDIQSTVFKTEYLKKIGGFDLKYSELYSWPLWIRICRLKEKVKFVNDIFVDNRIENIKTDIFWVASFNNETFYNECIELLKNEALPNIKCFKDILRCKHSIFCLKAKRIKEAYWDDFTLMQKIKWRVKNIDGLAISSLYNLKNKSVNININRLLVCIIIILTLINRF